MNTLVIGNQTVSQRRAEIARAWRTGTPEAAARLDFESLEGAWSLLTAKRRAVLRAMEGQGPLSIRAIARRVGRRRPPGAPRRSRAAPVRRDRPDRGRQDGPAL